MNKRIGSSFEDFLEGTELKDEVEGLAQRRVYAWQIHQALESGGITKSELAKRMNTNRSQVARLLDPTNTAVRLDILQRAARAIAGSFSSAVENPSQYVGRAQGVLLY